MNKNNNQTLIHIKSESPFFSSSELVPEKIAVKRLEDIRDNFTKMQMRYSRTIENATLKVQTCVHNPKMF